MSKAPTNANRVLSALRKMFNLAEVWGLRPDGSNACRHIPKYPERGKTRLITDAELKRLYAYLHKAEVEGLEHPLILLAVRLQFEFTARMSEILTEDNPVRAAADAVALRPLNFRLTIINNSVE